MTFLTFKRWLGIGLACALGTTVVPQTAQAGDQPYVGEIAWVAFNFPPINWALCDGSLLPIADYSALYSVLGTTYGGDGVTTFGLPDMRGRSPIHVGTNYPLGQMGGEETHRLTTNELPIHTHVPQVDAHEATAASPTTSSYLAKTSTGTSAYGSTTNTSLGALAVGSAGGSQPHENMKPFQTLNCIIATNGIYPSP